MFTLATGLLLGSLLGMRHALEPDHLAAVSVLVTRGGARRGAAALGAVWGLGHSLSLFVVGCVLAAIGAQLPNRLGDAFELLVGVMLMALGGRAVLRALPGATPSAPRRHPGQHQWLRQPLIVGMIHGLAGSGALTALVLANLPTAAMRLGYIALFGLGSVVGMAFLTGLAGWPLARLDERGKVAIGLSLATGTMSFVLGSFWGWAALHDLLRG